MEKGKHPHRRLSPTAVRTLARGRHADGNGLYLEVDTGGARRWLLRTVVHGRRRDIGLGSASVVSLADAREEAARLRAVARKGGDPIAERDRDKRRSISFAEAAARVHGEHIASTSRNPKHAAQWLRTLETHAFPSMRLKPVHAVDQADVLRVLAPIWTERPETARRIKQRIKTVLDWATAAGHRDGVNPVVGIEKALPRQRKSVRHFAALPWRELPSLMERLGAVDGVGAQALRFAILTAARSGEVRGARWSEIDLEARVWSIPAERMKAGKEHRVPLSPAAITILNEVAPLATTADALVFPSTRPGRPLSDMSLSAVLKRLELPVTVHGFRSTFRDWAEEATSFPHEVKEAALAHTVRNKAEAAYRRTDLFEKRRGLMDAWASLAAGGPAKVIRLGA